MNCIRLSRIRTLQIQIYANFLFVFFLFIYLFIYIMIDANNALLFSRLNDSKKKAKNASATSLISGFKICYTNTAIFNFLRGMLIFILVFVSDRYYWLLFLLERFQFFANTHQYVIISRRKFSCKKATLAAFILLQIQRSLHQFLLLLLLHNQLYHLQNSLKELTYRVPRRPKFLQLFLQLHLQISLQPNYQTGQ